MLLAVNILSQYEWTVTVPPFIIAVIPFIIAVISLIGWLSRFVKRINNDSNKRIDDFIKEELNLIEAQLSTDKEYKE